MSDLDREEIRARATMGTEAAVEPWKRCGELARDALTLDADLSRVEAELAEAKAENSRLRGQLVAARHRGFNTKAALADMTAQRDALIQSVPAAERAVIAERRAEAAEAEAAKLRKAIRDAWNAHMERCLGSSDLPTFEDIERWRNAPSGTADAALANEGEG